MQVSNEAVKKFLLEVIDQVSYPGNMVDFVASVRKEVAGASVEEPAKKGGKDK